MKKYIFGTVKILLFITFITGCNKNSVENSRLQETAFLSVNENPDYIDPRWPPSCGVDLSKELKASSVMDHELCDVDKKKVLRGEPLVEGDTPGLYVHEGHVGNFDYLEVIYGNITDANESLPLIVMLHSRGSKPVIPQKYFNDNLKVRIFMPRANKKLGKGYTWLDTYSKSPRRKLFVRSLKKRALELSNAINEFTQMRPTTGKPVLIGFSQGGILAWTIGLNYPQTASAIYSIAGWIPDALIPVDIKENSKYPQMNIYHGTADKIVPYEYGKKSADNLKAKGISINFYEYPEVGHVVTNEIKDHISQRIFKYVSN